MKNLRNSFVILCASAFCFSLAIAGCFNKKGSSSGATGSSGQTSVPSGSYEVLFNTRGGSEVPSQIVKSGEKATKPSDPTYDGYKFRGWYQELEAVTEFSFDTPITSPTTVYAGWELDPGSVYPGGGGGGSSQPAGETKTFTVDAGVWDSAAAASYYAYAWGGNYGEGEGAGAFIAISAGSFIVNNDATGLILLRLDPSKTAGWDAVWNQTEDITPVDYTKSGIRVTGWGSGTGAKCTWEWIA